MPEAIDRAPGCCAACPVRARAAGVPPELLASLYPTGRRNYLRVYPTDDLQGAALALHARDRGRRSVYILDDGEPGYGALMATGFSTAARRLGLRIAGRSTWDPQAASYTALARRVADSGAQAVFVGGLLDTNAARVVRDLRPPRPGRRPARARRAHAAATARPLGGARGAGSVRQPAGRRDRASATRRGRLRAALRPRAEQ